MRGCVASARDRDQSVASPASAVRLSIASELLKNQRWSCGAPSAACSSACPAASSRGALEELDRAIAARQWFDPWVYEAEDEVSPHELVLPWVAGFAAAMDRFPALMRIDDPALLEPLALIYAAFDPDDLEDSDALLGMIETLEPPATLAQAAEDLVRSVLLIADISRPLAAPPQARRPRRH